MNFELLRLIGKHVKENGLECLLVGGAVRDFLTLGEQPNDYDFVCNDSEKLVSVLEEKYPEIHVKKFKKYGTFQFQLLGESVEFVNPRKEAYMTWSHKPQCVPGTIEDDIYRRDFTINTLAIDVCDDSFNIIDITGKGKLDLKFRFLRCVSNPEKTFKEDPSRLIRLCYYAAKGFNPNTEIMDAVIKKSYEICRVPLDAIKQMMDKGILINGFMDWMYDLGILQHIIPEFEGLHTYKQPQKHHIHNVWVHTLKTIEYCPKDKILRWSALFHDIGKKVVWDERGNYHGHEDESEKITKKILINMKFSNDEMRKILHLVRYHMTPTLTCIHNKPTKKSIGRFFRKHEQYLQDLKTLVMVDILASGVHVNPDLEKIGDFFDRVDELRTDISILEEGKLTFKLDYTGHDIMKKFKIKPSSLVGDIKGILEEKVCSKELENNWDSIDEYCNELNKNGIKYEKKTKNSDSL